MATRTGISGTSVALATVGGIVVYAGMRGVSPTQALRDLLRGNVSGLATPTVSAPIVDNPTALLSGGVSGAGSPALVQAAEKYLGLPYKWGGTFNPPSKGGDCSGLVQRSFADIGISCPRTSWQIRAWGMLRAISPPPTAGDVLWWPGHVAIATSATMMIEAPTFGIPVRNTAIRKGYTVLRYSGITAGLGTR